MSLRKLLPRTKISEETFRALAPVFEGEVFFKKGRYQEAEARYLGALKDFPEGSGGRVLVYNKLGILYERLNQSERAIDIYGKAVEEGAVTPFTYARLSALHLDAGRLSEALGYCDRGIRSLKKAHTDFFQEAYFWLVFQGLKFRIRRRGRKA